MAHPLFVSIARRLPYLSRAIERIDTLQSENDALKRQNADAMAWLDIASKWLDRSKVAFDADGLIVLDRPATFLDDPKFREAYLFGVDSGHKFSGDGGKPSDLHIEWRVVVALWAAWHAKQLPGDFVECGVNTGILSRAICRYLDFNTTGKHFFLFDTYEGVPEEQAETGREADIAHINALSYFDAWELIQRNFSEFPNAKPIRGRVPDSLRGVGIDRVCYLSIDMNVTEPEVAALEYFWPKLVPGGVVVFDDYGFHLEQQEALNRLTAKWGVKILLMPTGQGLLIKP